MTGSAANQAPIRQKTVECGKIDFIDAYDVNGDPIRYQISAVPPATGGRTPAEDAPASGSASPVQRISSPPLHALIDVVPAGRSYLHDVGDLHLTVEGVDVSELPVGQWANAVVCPLGVIEGYGEMTIELPADIGAVAGRGMLVLLGPESG